MRPAGRSRPWVSPPAAATDRAPGARRKPTAPRAVPRARPPRAARARPRPRRSPVRSHRIAALAEDGGHARQGLGDAMANGRGQARLQAAGEEVHHRQDHDRRPCGLLQRGDVPCGRRLGPRQPAATPGFRRGPRAGIPRMPCRVPVSGARSIAPARRSRCAKACSARRRGAGPRRRLTTIAHARRYPDEEPRIEDAADRRARRPARNRAVERVGRDQRDNPGDRLELARGRRKGQAERHQRHRRNAPQRLLDDLDGERQHEAEDQRYQQQHDDAGDDARCPVGFHHEERDVDRQRRSGVW